METVVTVLMLLIALVFVLKQSFGKPWTVLAAAAAAALFTGLIWPLAIGQSKSRISAWLADSALMLDAAVVLSVEIVLQMAFCMMAAGLSAEGRMPRWKIVAYRILRWFPGVLIFPVLFSALVYVIFAFPGNDFKLTAWILAALVFILIPAGAWAFRKAIPEKELRLELLFILNALTAIFGVMATVNGRTAVDGFSEVDWGAFAGIVLITLAGAFAGWLWHLLKSRKA